MDRRAFLAAGATMSAEMALAAAAPVPASVPASVRWDEEFDVVVVGSGAAGCSAAIFAHEAGARVLVLEKGPIRGGTTAKSGGQFWIPNNRYLRTRGLDDPKDAFLRYVARYSYPAQYDPSLPGLGIDPNDLALAAAFYDSASVMIDEMERLGVFEAGLVALTPEDDQGTYDYFSEAPEDVRKSGRTLHVQGPGMFGGGADLIAFLGSALDKRRIPVRLNHGVVDVVGAGSGVAGVVVRLEDGATRRIRARGGVIFCTGGFAQDRIKRLLHHPEPIFGTCAVPEATGDFLSIAAGIGARLGNLSGAWRAQCVLKHAIAYPVLPDEAFSPTTDSAFVVNRFGRRCVNEHANYHDRARTTYRWDENHCEYPDLLHILIYDQRCAELYGGYYPFPLANDTRADWVVHGSTMGELAKALVDHMAELAPYAGGVTLAPDFAETLQATTVEFNRMAVAGNDLLFARGATERERRYQKYFIAAISKLVNGKEPPNPHPNICMHPLAATGPYHAIVLAPSVLDTNGGPVIDTSGQVVNVEGRPIPGLYAAGNCTASPARDAYWGAGVTIGLGMTFGMLAGRAAARQAAVLAAHGAVA